MPGRHRKLKIGGISPFGDHGTTELVTQDWDTLDWDTLIQYLWFRHLQVWFRSTTSSVRDSRDIIWYKAVLQEKTKLN